MTRREAWLSAGLVFVVALARPRLGRGPGPVPDPGGRHLLLGCGAQPGRRARADLQRALELRDRRARRVGRPEPGRSPARPSRSGCRSPRSSRRSRWPCSGRLPTPPRSPVPVLTGALIPVLAWRVGADLAAERGLRPGAGTHARAGKRARERGRASRSSCRRRPGLDRRRSACGAGGVPPDGPAGSGDPRGARACDARVIGLGAAIGIAYLSRNEAVWVGLAWLAIAAGRTGAGAPGRVAARAGGGRRRAARRCRPWLVRRLAHVRRAASRPGGHQRVLADGPRDLRLDGPADAVAVPRRRRRRPG